MMRIFCKITYFVSQLMYSCPRKCKSTLPLHLTTLHLAQFFTLHLAPCTLHLALFELALFELAPFFHLALFSPCTFSTFLHLAPCTLHLTCASNQVVLAKIKIDFKQPVRELLIFQYCILRSCIDVTYAASPLLHLAHLAQFLPCTLYLAPCTLHLALF